MGAIGCNVCSQWAPSAPFGIRRVVEQHIVECLAYKYGIRPDRKPGDGVHWHIDLNLGPPTAEEVTICIIA